MLRVITQAILRAIYQMVIAPLCRFAPLTYKLLCHCSIYRGCVELLHQTHRTPLDSIGPRHTPPDSTGPHLTVPVLTFVLKYRNPSRVRRNTTPNPHRTMSRVINMIQHPRTPGNPIKHVHSSALQLLGAI